jgi:hypothetical protein
MAAFESPSCSVGLKHNRKAGESNEIFAVKNRLYLKVSICVDYLKS